MDILFGIVIGIAAVLVFLFGFGKELGIDISFRKNQYVKFFTRQNVTYYMTKDGWEEFCEYNASNRVYLQGYIINKMAQQTIPAGENFKFLIYFTQTVEEQKAHSTNYTINLQQLVEPLKGK